ncbi:MAG TPA: tyrosine-type recombinase/integrase, partial [Pirellulales bacterium]
YDACLVDRPMRFGPSFKKPKLRTMRRARRERGSMMFEAEEIRALLAIARPSVQAMIMLGVNCGFGTADVGTLPKSAIDLKSGWVNYPRPKTEMDRRCPLWPETVGAIERASVLRPTPRLSEYADLVFLTPRGGQWANGRQAKSALSHDIRRLVRSAGSDAGNGRGFYALRRTFETIGSEALDQAAVDLIMGHCPRADDMPARYRQRVGDDRLIAVTEHVRLWLFPTARDNHFQQCRERAGGILAEWNGVERLSPQDISAAIKSLRISQTELARGIGLNLQTVNAALCCRKPLSAEVVFRIRRFFQQVADGVGRTPIVSPAPTSAWAAPTAPIPGAIPASPEIEKLFDGRPFTVADFVIVQRYLRDNFGIKNRTLSIWLGYKKRDHLSKIVWRQSKINFASRLRKLFVFAQEGGAT